MGNGLGLLNQHHHRVSPHLPDLLWFRKTTSQIIWILWQSVVSNEAFPSFGILKIKQDEVYLFTFQPSIFFRVAGEDPISNPDSSAVHRGATYRDNQRQHSECFEQLTLSYIINNPNTNCNRPWFVSSDQNRHFHFPSPFTQTSMYIPLFPSLLLTV